MKKNTGKHPVWLTKQCDIVIRTVWEIDGKLFIKNNGRWMEVSATRRDEKNMDYATV